MRNFERQRAKNITSLLASDAVQRNLTILITIKSKIAYYNKTNKYNHCSYIYNYNKPKTKNYKRIILIKFLNVGKYNLDQFNFSLKQKHIRKIYFF